MKRCTDCGLVLSVLNEMGLCSWCIKERREGKKE